MKPADKPKKVVPASARAKPRKPDTSGSVSFTAILFNVAGAIVAVLIVMALFQHNDPDPNKPGDLPANSGYDWLYNTMVKGNLKTIEDNPDKTTREKYILKWGPGEVLYIDSVKKLTPENAIVMLPPKSVLQGVGFKSVVDLPWVTYFLYPRQVVYGDSVNDPLYAKANYLMSLQGWGLDKVKTPIEKPSPFMVLPLTK